MWIAGGGEKVTLKIAAQYAAYTNFGGLARGGGIRKSEVPARALRRDRRDFALDHRARRTFNTIVGRDRGRGPPTAWPRVKAGLASAVGSRSGPTSIGEGVPRRRRGSAPSTGSPRPRRARTRTASRARDPLLPRRPRTTVSGIELFERKVIAALVVTRGRAPPPVVRRLAPAPRPQTGGRLLGLRRFPRAGRNSDDAAGVAGCAPLALPRTGGRCCSLRERSTRSEAAVRADDDPGAVRRSRCRNRRTLLVWRAVRRSRC